MNLAAAARRMIEQDRGLFRDEGTCVLGAGIAVYAVPPRCRKPKLTLLIDAPFQGNVGSAKASERALKWLQGQGVEAFWYDGTMD
jgi:hypothetical protein